MVVSAPKHGTHNSKLQLLQIWQQSKMVEDNCVQMIASLLKIMELKNGIVTGAGRKGLMERMADLLLLCIFYRIRVAVLLLKV
jgi:hypothetical protein